MLKIKKLSKKNKADLKHGLKCQDCGKRSSSVTETTCPFDFEQGIITECILCPECEDTRGKDT